MLVPAVAALVGAERCLVFYFLFECSPAGARELSSPSHCICWRFSATAPLHTDRERERTAPARERSPTVLCAVMLLCARGAWRVAARRLPPPPPPLGPASIASRCFSCRHAGAAAAAGAAAPSQPLPRGDGGRPSAHSHTVAFFSSITNRTSAAALAYPAAASHWPSSIRRLATRMPARLPSELRGAPCPTSPLHGTGALWTTERRDRLRGVPAFARAMATARKGAQATDGARVDQDPWQAPAPGLFLQANVRGRGLQIGRCIAKYSEDESARKADLWSLPTLTREKERRRKGARARARQGDVAAAPKYHVLFESGEDVVDAKQVHYVLPPAALRGQEGEEIPLMTVEHMMETVRHMARAIRDDELTQTWMKYKAHRSGAAVQHDDDTSGELSASLCTEQESGANGGGVGDHGGRDAPVSGADSSLSHGPLVPLRDLAKDLMAMFSTAITTAAEQCGVASSCVAHSFAKEIVEYSPLFVLHRGNRFQCASNVSVEAIQMYRKRLAEFEADGELLLAMIGLRDQEPTFGVVPPNWMEIKPLRNAIERLKHFALFPDEPEMFEAPIKAFLRQAGVAETSRAAREFLYGIGVWTSKSLPFLRHLCYDPVKLHTDRIIKDNLNEHQHLELHRGPDIFEKERITITHPVFSIDSEDSPFEVDDAVSWERREDGEWLMIHVADVAHYVEAESAADQVARARVRSVYVGADTLSMMPGELVDIMVDGERSRITRFFELLSVSDKRESMCLTFAAKLRSDGAVDKFQIWPTLLKRVERKSFAQVDTMFKGRQGFIPPEIQAIVDNARARQAYRKMHGAHIENYESFENPDASVAHATIKEMMLLAGELAGRYCMQFAIPALYRAHARSARAPAKYTTSPSQHDDLGLFAFVQVTSPIRRYVDLIMHRQLRSTISALTKKSKPLPSYDSRWLQDLCYHVNERTDVIAQVEAAALRFDRLSVLEQQQEASMKKRGRPIRVLCRVESVVRDGMSDKMLYSLRIMGVHLTLRVRANLDYSSGDELFATVQHVNPDTYTLKLSIGRKNS